MTTKLVYTDEAISDLKRLRDFIKQNNPSAAQRIASTLINRMTTLQDFPQLGKPVESSPVPGSIRDMVFDQYIVRYSVHTSTVIILRIWHELENARFVDAN